MIRNDIFTHGNNSKNKSREEKRRQINTEIENAPSMKRINLTAKVSSNTYPIEVDLFNTRKSTATNSITKMIHTQDSQDNYPLLDESSSLDSTLSDDNMGGLESMPHVIEMQNENRKQKESGLTDSERVDLELMKREITNLIQNPGAYEEMKRAATGEKRRDFLYSQIAAKALL